MLSTLPSLTQLFLHIPVASLPYLVVLHTSLSTAQSCDGANVLPSQPEQAQEEEEEASGGGTLGRKAELGTQPQMPAITI